MPCYYFNIHNSVGLTRDEEGEELPDLEAARDAAIAGIRSLIGEGLAEAGTIDLAGRIDICDREGATLLSIPFADAVEIQPPGEEPT